MKTIDLPRFNFLRTENYKIKNIDELKNILKEYVDFCQKKKYKVGTTLSVLRYYTHLETCHSKYFLLPQREKYSETKNRKRIEFIGKSLFFGRTHGNLKDVIFDQSCYTAKKFDLKNMKHDLYVNPEKLQKFLTNDGN